ncbi:MAG: DUF2339 domain-containing protein [Fusobacterium ulcerans]|uniref:DUF2339 domain-containing protein n=1 Tax=Fusobacterium ulcerans TaxID=861 RepID=UPI003A8ACBAE
MIDKKKELELLEAKYQEIKRLNSEAESIISGIKNDADINRETQLLEEKEKLEKILKEIKDELQKKTKEIEDLKNSNVVLLEELKESKRLRREKEINKFQIMAAKKVKIDLEDRIINRLNNFRKELHKKINIQDKELMKEMSKESHELRAELKAVAEKADIFIENSRKKALEAGISLGEESSVFHSEIQKEYDLKEDKYLYEKEKKNFVLEKLIGLKGFNFLGIISIFLGIFLVFKTQFRDFFNNDYIKSSGSYLLGIIFLFAGERLYQKKKKHFAVGLIGGGIGILYITTLLSTMYLGLFSMILGLFISVILTGLVVVLALRYSSQIIGVLALIGGYLPYGAYIYYEGGITKIYYLIAYSLILQGIVLGISWKKDWLYSKIIGFVIGSTNMAGIVFYLSKNMDDKLTAFFYIVIFTTAYSFIFLNSHRKENRESNIVDYILLSLNLIVKFSLIYSLSDGTTPSWMKAGLVAGVGIIYGFFGDKLKENRVSKIFYVIALGCFIVIIPVILSKEYIVVAWGLEAVFLYFMASKYNNKEVEYGAVFIYLITLLTNFFIREEKYYLVYIQDILIISLSFVVYFIVKEKSYNKTIKSLMAPFKYLIFLYSIFFINNVIFLNIKKLPGRYYTKEMLGVLIGILVINLLLRTVTYKVKELQDRFSLIFLTIIEIFSILIINVINMFGYVKYESGKEKIVLIAVILAVNIYLFFFGRKDIHFTIFKTNEKKVPWIIGESIYIIVVSYLVMNNVLYIDGANLVINIVGLLMCGYLVWKGFKTPNRNIRRVGLGIGIFFVLKSFFIDFVSFSSTYKLLAYFSMGIILIGTSYIYQTALKKLEKEEKGE